MVYYPDRFISAPLYLFELKNGMTSFGGFLGVAVGFIIATRRAKVSLLPYADAAAYGFPWGWIFGRLGCTITFDHPGKLTSFFLAMAYPGNATLAAGIRHNLGFDEVLWAVAISLLFLSQRRRQFAPGTWLGALLLSYMPLRFFLDFLREDEARYWLLTPAQMIAVPLTAVGVWLVFLRTPGTVLCGRGGYLRR